VNRITPKQCLVVSPQKQLKIFSKSLAKMQEDLKEMMNLVRYCGPDEVLISHINSAKLAVGRAVKQLEGKVC
jgi:hypothetical protein